MTDTARGVGRRVRGGVRGEWHPRHSPDERVRSVQAGAADTSAAGVGGAGIARPLDGLAAHLDALREDRRTALVIGPVAAFVAVFLLRFIFIDRAYDIFTDEVTYLQISQSVAAGRGVLLHGNLFFLHPPLFFLLEGAVLSVFHPTGLIIDQVQAIRTLNAMLAGITGVAIFVLVSRLAGWRAALAALLVFALDPFIIRLNSRNLIETAAFMWVALGYLVLLSAVGPDVAGDGGAASRMATDSPSLAEAPRWRLLRVVAAGLLFGCALLSKEMTAFLTVVPVGFAFLLGMSLRRPESLAAVVAAAATYSIYPLTVVALGLGPQFADQKLSGLLRFLGIVKTTGFVSSGGPSFASAITRNLDVFATTYALIAIGIPACLVLLAWGGPRRRLIGLLGASAYALLAYSIKFGTLEEQFFYYLVLPALLTVSVAWWMVVAERRLLSDPRGWPASLHRRAGALFARVHVHDAHRARQVGEDAVRVVAPVAFTVAVGWSVLVWSQVHFTPDNGYERLLAYMHRTVPNGTTVGVTTDPQQFILQGYVIEQVQTTKSLAQARARYVAISTKQIEDGYVKNGASILQWLQANARPVFTFQGRSYGTLELFRVTPPLTGTAAGGGP